MKRSFQHALIALLSFALVACGGDGSSLSLPGTSAYTLTLAAAPSTATSNTAPINLVATLRDATNTAVIGATVQFQSTVGRLGTATAQTDGAGSASVALFAGTGGAASGQATVTFLDPDRNVARATLLVSTLGDETTGGTPVTPGTPGTPTLTVSLLSGAGTPSDAANPVTNTSPGTLRATVLNAAGAPVANALVTFSIDSIASLSQTTALTNASGVAQVTVAATSTGAGTARATATVSGTALSGSTVFATLMGGGTTPGVGPSMALEVRTGGGVLVDSANPLTNLSPGQLIATITENSAPRSGVLVTFSVPPSVTLGQTSALTDASGRAIVSITATETGAGTATAIATVGTVQVTGSAVFATSVGSAAVDTPVMTLVVLDAADTPVSAAAPITSTAPGKARATITVNGVPEPNALVTFALVSGSGAALSATNALTNASGVAEVPVEAASTGAGILSAAATVSSVALTAQQTYATALQTAAPLVLDLGFMAATFTPDVLGTNVTGAIAPKSDVVITAHVLNTATSALYPDAVTVSFGSTCVTQGKATIDASATTVNGRATATYRPVACTGQDTVTATVITPTQTLTATATVSILAEELGSLAFVEANPETLALKGTGGSGRLESSDVKFRVLGAQGNPLAEKPVCFLLSTNVGGIALPQPRAMSNGSGEVIAVVQSGSVPTPVRVTAYIDDNDTCADAKPSTGLIQTVSDVLTVSTGLPHQRSFSLAVDPIDTEPAFSYDGVTWSASVFLADHFNNPVPDGTAVNFWTELGAIQPSCTTVGGTCSVEWRSQAPRDGYDVRDRDDASKPEPTRFRDRRGRSTILAYAVGEESFVDFNGNGLFDGDNANEVASVVGTANDLEEVIKDTDNITYVINTFARYLEALVLGEEFVDFDGDGTHDTFNERFDGVLCGTGGLCSGDATVHVRGYNEIVMSTNSARVYIVQPDVNLSGLDFDVNGFFTGITNPADTAYDLDGTGQVVTQLYGLRGGSRFVVLATDSNGNQLASGTIVRVTANSAAGSVDGKSSYTLARVVGEADWFGAMFSLKAPTTAPTQVGTVTIEVEHPDGVTQVFFLDADWITP